VRIFIIFALVSFRHGLYSRHPASRRYLEESTTSERRLYSGRRC